MDTPPATPVVPETPPEPIAPAPTVERRIVRIRHSSYDAIKVGTGMRVDGPLWITREETGLCSRIADLLTGQDIDARLLEKSMVEEILAGSAPSVEAGGLIILSGVDRIFPVGDTPGKQVTHAFQLARFFGRLLTDGPAADAARLFVTISRMDGGFGFTGAAIDHPYAGALAGLAKTAGIEWPMVRCLSLDIAPALEADKAASSVVHELLSEPDGHHVEIGISARGRGILELASSQADEFRPIPLQTGEPVVISGGARGITAACAAALAREVKAHFVLLGRTPAPVPEPEWLQPLTAMSDIKRAILEHECQGTAAPKEIENAYRVHMANREILKTLTSIADTGATVEYVSVDVCDADGLKHVFTTIRQEHGPIRALIHAAGVLHDKQILDKPLDAFNRVWETKVDGFDHLVRLTAEDPLRYLIVFSSVSARFGNVGQVDYAMANEVLNKRCAALMHERPDCRVISINWGPWDGGMVTSSLRRDFMRRSIPLIDPVSGADCLVREMAAVDHSSVEVIYGSGLPAAAVSGKPAPRGSRQGRPALTTVSTHTISTTEYPILQHHIIAGRPVVPFALLAEWLGHCALHDNPGLEMAGFDDLRLTNGIKLDGEGHRIQMMAGKALRKQDGYEVTVEIRNAGTAHDAPSTHARAVAILTESRPVPPSSPRQVPGGLTPLDRSLEEVYRSILFHGEPLQGIRDILGLDDRRMAARLSTAPKPNAWVRNPLRSRWISDPLVLDAAFQMAIVWCAEKHGQMSLPVYIGSYRQYCRRFPDDGVTAIMHITDTSRRKITGDFQFLDKNGHMLAVISNYEAIMDRSLSDAFKQKNAA